MIDTQNHQSKPSHLRRNLVIALGILWITVPALLGFTLLARIGDAGDSLRQLPDAGIFIFIAIFALTTGFGLLPPYAQTILGAWVFGIKLGATAVMCGLLGGAIIGFFFARLVSGTVIIEFIDRNPRARVIRAALVDASQRRIFFLIILLRLPPNSPFAMANLAMGASGVRAFPFIAATAIGMLPRTLVICTATAAAAATGANNFQELFAKEGWLWVAVGFASLLIALTIIRMIAMKALKAAGLLPPPTTAPTSRN